MITKFKLYEVVNQCDVGKRPKIYIDIEKGDYVACEYPSNSFFDTELMKYININEIGYIVDIEDRSNLCLIQFEHLPKKYSTDNHLGQRYISTGEIKYWSKSKEELEEFLIAKKYNL